MKITDTNRDSVKAAVDEQVDDATEYLGFRVHWEGDYEYVTISLRKHVPRPQRPVGQYL